MGLLRVRLAAASIAAILVFQAGAVAPALSYAAGQPSETANEPLAIQPLQPQQRVELLDKRTADSRTFANPDGSFTTESFAGPIHYRGDSGRFEPIDVSAVAGDGTDVAFQTKASAVRAELGTKSATGTLLRVSDGTHQISFRPILPPGLSNAARAIDRAPVASGSQVTYADVYPNVDLRYTLLANGAKEDIVLKSSAAASVYGFVLNAPGLTARLADDGSVRIGDLDGDVFAIPAPFMVDSAPEPDGDGARSTAVHYRLITVGSNTVLVVEADRAWLDDPARVYPVFVDPTTTTTRSATLDTFISSAYPNTALDQQWNPGEGGYYELWNGQYDAGSGNNIAYVKTGLPTGVTVSSATFNIYVQHSYSLATPTSIYLGKLTSAFTAGQTWNMTDPSWSALTSDSVADNQWASFSVTSTVKDWIYGAATNYGFRVYESSTSQSLWKRLRASENATNAPYLSVTYWRPSAATISPVGGAWGRNVLTWSYTDNGSGLPQSRISLQVSKSSTNWAGTDLVFDLSSTAYTTHSYTIPTTNLVEGTTYYWHVSVKDSYSWSGYTPAASWKYDGSAPALQSVAVGGAVSSNGSTYYQTGTGTFTVKLRARDSFSGTKLSYLRLYNATDEDRTYHDWSVGGTNCSEFNTSTLVDVTACAETYNTAPYREVQYTAAGLGANASFTVQHYFTDYAGNLPADYANSGPTLVFDATAPTGSISSPAANATVSGTLTITGTASDANFSQYELHYGAGASPTTWTSIGTNPRTSQVTNATLGSWNTTAVADGTYTIRLRVYDRARVSSGFTELKRTISVDNTRPTALISSPLDATLVDGTLTIAGTASAPVGFSTYTLHYGVGCAPSSWADVGTNPRSTQVSNGTLGSWDTAGLAGEYTIRLVASQTDGSTATDTVCVTLGSTLGQQRQHTFERWDLGGGDEAAVNVASGNLVLSHPLVDLPYRGGSLSLDLTYNSLDPTNVGLGSGWRLSLQRRLVLNPNGTITFVDADGARHLFSAPVTNGTVTTYTRPASLYAALVKDTAQANQFTLTYKDQTRDEFAVAGSEARLVRSQDGHANGVDLAYDASGNLATVTDPAGRQVSFSWDIAPTPDRMTSISDWAWIDAGGVVQSTATGSHRTYRLFYDASGALAGWSDPLNTTGSCPTGGSHITCLSYTTGQLTAISKTQTVTTLSAGALGTTSRPITTTFSYGGGRVASVTDAEQQAIGGSATTFTVVTPTEVEVARPTTTTSYGLVASDDPYGRVTSVWRHLDSSTRIERRTVWDTTFPTEPASVTDNYGALLGTPARTTSYSYVAGSLGNLAKLVEPLTASTNRWTEYSYNPNNDVTQTIVSQDGSASLRTITRICYDAGCTLTGAGPDLLKQIDNYVSGGAQNNDTNVTTDYIYDAYGQRTATTRHNRDASGAVLDDRVDAFTYDSYGNLTAEIVNYADGAVSAGADLDPDATTQARTDLTTTYTYDTAGNRISSADPRRAILAATGSPGAGDYVTRWTHDALNQKLTEKTPTTPGVSIAQKTSNSTYDELGNLRSATDFGGLVTATEFDRAGRATGSYEQAAGEAARQTAETAYDADGHTLSSADERQLGDATLGVTAYEYDPLGRQVASIEGAGSDAESRTETEYDGLDRRASYTIGVDPVAGTGQDTLYAYDLGGRTIQTDDGFACTTEQFDYRDHATTTTSGLEGGTCAAGVDQRTLSHSYDGLGRRVRDEVTAGAGSGDRTLDDVFDAAGNRRSASTTKAGVSATTTFEVNLLDQPVTEERADGSLAATTYDASGNAADRCFWRTSVSEACAPVGSSWTTAPDQVTSTTYDARDQRISLVNGATNGTTIYDADHNYQVKASYLPTGGGREQRTLYTYDPRHRLEAIRVEACAADAAHTCTDTPIGLGSDQYDYDDSDNRTAVTESADGSAGTLRTYCYDARNQLVARTSGSTCAEPADETYVYDDAGNRTSKTAGGSTTAFAYDSEGRLCAVGASDCTSPTVTYDSAGRTETWNGWSFTYDAESRLVGACKPSCAAGNDQLAFSYDGEGHRTKITAISAAGTTTVTEFRYQGDAIVEEKTDGAVERTFVVDDAGSIVKMTIPSGPNAGDYLINWNGHGDALNLVRLNADGTTTLANSFSYGTWGEPTTSTHSGIGDLGFRFLYVGQSDVQWDNAFGLGLYYMHARHYAPTLGRFLQPDPDGAEDSLYAYVSNNPVTVTDAEGTCPFCIIAAIVVIGAAIDTVDYLASTPESKRSVAGWAGSVGPGVAMSVIPGGRITRTLSIGARYAASSLAKQGARAAIGVAFRRPQLLRYVSPRVGAAVGRAAGWDVRPLTRGGHRGLGVKISERLANGSLTGRQLRWHPGGGHHGPRPYWFPRWGNRNYERVHQ